MCKEEFAQAIDKAVFPGLQGGPLEHIIAGKAVALLEASKPEFKEYAKQIVKNAKALAQGLMDEGMDIVGGMTENHLMTLDLRKTGKTGKDMANVLEVVGITANGHSIYSFDPASRKAKRKRYSYRAWFNSVKEAIPDEYRNTILKAPPCSFIE